MYTQYAHTALHVAPQTSAQSRFRRRLRHRRRILPHGAHARIADLLDGRRHGHTRGQRRVALLLASAILDKPSGLTVRVHTTPHAGHLHLFGLWLGLVDAGKRGCLQLFILYLRTQMRIEFA